jgi:hypothetical protein
VDVEYLRGRFFINPLEARKDSSFLTKYFLLKVEDRVHMLKEFYAEITLLFLSNNLGTSGLQVLGIW